MKTINAIYNRNKNTPIKTSGKSSRRLLKTVRHILVLSMSLKISVATAECLTALAPELPSADFTIETNRPEIVTHTKTALMWSRCAVGQHWEPTTAQCEGNPQLFTWQQALQYSSQLSDYHDWRLPNKKELASIVEYQCHSPATNSVIFPNTPNSQFWTSSPVPYASMPLAWWVDFSDGSFGNSATDTTLPVRLVRQP